MRENKHYNASGISTKANGNNSCDRSTRVGSSCKQGVTTPTKFGTPNKATTLPKLASVTVSANSHK